MSTPGDPDTVRSLEILESTQRQLGDALTRLADAAARAGGLAAQTDWRTDAALLFHAKSQALRRELVTLGGDIDDARDHLRRVQAGLETGAGWWGW